jgi:hypothetical protein
MYNIYIYKLKALVKAGKLGKVRTVLPQTDAYTKNPFKLPTDTELLAMRQTEKKTKEEVCLLFRLAVHTVLY